TGGSIPTTWGLPVPLQEETGIIMATAFPGLESFIEEISRYFAYRYAAKPWKTLWGIYDKMISLIGDEVERKRLADWYAEQRALLPAGGEENEYRFSRSFLFRVLSLGHAQTSQFLKAKGPCTQVNAACASTTQAVGIAEDWIRLGRAKRVIVIAADDITGKNAFQWLGVGFLASGAASTKNVVSEAALPFDRRRGGMIVGMGAAGMVLEDGRALESRGMKPLAELLAAQFDNSAYHLTRLHTRHVCKTMERLVSKAELRHGLARSDMAGKMLFMSHETYTPAQGGSSQAEAEALKAVFGADTPKVVVTNTKGFTGHSMGASLEDVVAVRAMNLGKLPPIANFKEPDPELAGITLSKGGDYDCEFALRLGAGFGSQIAMTLMRRGWKAGEPRTDKPRYEGWLKEITQDPEPVLEVVHNTLRVMDKKGKARKGVNAPLPVLPVSPAPSAPAVPPAAPKPPVPARAAAQPAANLSEAAVLADITALVSEKTGYPPDMLEPDLDMEADLGIDTVKQAELIGIIRDKYSIPRSENLSLKDYPTLRHVAKFVMMGGASTPPIMTVSPASSSPVPAAPTPPVQPAALPAADPAAPAAAALDESAVMRDITALVSEKTGYPPDMLEPDLDMEADLGIDTVKQAELIGIIRDK
ncbi:MAG: phosphopantetheine-binding protein, partial [Elusimicrobiota bacterium]